MIIRFLAGMVTKLHNFYIIGIDIKTATRPRIRVRAYAQGRGIRKVLGKCNPKCNRKCNR